MTRNPLVWLACAGVCASASAQQFFPIIDPSNPNQETRAQSISPDGQTVVGVFDALPSTDEYRNGGIFRWSLAGGFEDLRDEAAFPFYSMGIFGASDASDVVVGQHQSAPGIPVNGYRYSDADGYAFIDPDPDPPSFRADGISGDGNVITGSRYISTPDTFSQVASIVRPDGSFLDLGLLGGPNPFLNRSSAEGASYDGSVIVGVSSDVDSFTNPFVWTEAEGMRRITSFESASASGVSRDGQWVFGTVYGDGLLYQGFRWSEDTGEEILGNLPGLGDHKSGVSDISDDGTVIVGFAQPDVETVAMVWTEATGMLSLKGLLEGSFGLDLTGWELTYASSVSADGTVVTGYGIDPEGYQRAFVATIPAPASLLVLGAWPAIARRRR